MQYLIVAKSIRELRIKSANDFFGSGSNSYSCCIVSMLPFSPAGGDKKSVIYPLFIPSMYSDNNA